VVSATADTNIYISALNFGGNPRTFLELAEAGKFRLAISGAILAEIGKVLRGDTFAWPEAEIERAQRQIARFAQHVEPVETVEVIKIDPPDNRILECAAAARSDYIVSGDKHLLRVKSFRDMPVVKVATFLDLVAKHARGQTL